DAEQDGSIRIDELAEVVMGRAGLGLAEELLVPLEAGVDVAHADDGPGAFHRPPGWIPDLGIEETAKVPVPMAMRLPLSVWTSAPTTMSDLPVRTMRPAERISVFSAGSRIWMLRFAVETQFSVCAAAVNQPALSIIDAITPP